RPISLEMRLHMVGYWMGPVGNWPVRIRYVARAWSPSLVLMERMTAQRSPNSASLGRFSVQRRPGAEVSFSLKGPPLAWPGFMSKVSVWAGPPLIHNRMQARLRCGFVAASAASVSSQPDIDPAETPAAASFSQSRRDRTGFPLVMRGMFGSPGRKAESRKQKADIRDRLSLLALRARGLVFSAPCLLPSAFCLLVLNG